MGRFAIVLVLCAGCGRLFGFDEVTVAECVYSEGPNDEDCDTVPNASDPCPADGAAADNADGDHDGVGDACDPSATTSEKIALFDGFSDDHNGWVAATGQWSPDHGAFVNTGDGRFKLTLPGPVLRPWIEFVIDDIVPMTDNASVGGYGANTSNSIACVVVFSQQNGESVVFKDGFSIIQLTQPISGTGRLRIQAGYFGDNKFHCRAQHGDNIPVELIIESTLTPENVPMTELGLTASGATARFDSVTLIAAP